MKLLTCKNIIEMGLAKSSDCCESCHFEFKLGFEPLHFDSDIFSSNVCCGILSAVDSRMIEKKLQEDEI